MHESLFPLKDAEGERERERERGSSSLPSSLAYFYSSLVPSSSVWALVFTENAHPTGQTR